jgi:hypothetical protein
MAEDVSEYGRFLEHSGSVIRDIMYASSSRYHPHIISYCVQSVETHSNVPHILQIGAAGGTVGGVSESSDV